MPVRICFDCGKKDNLVAEIRSDICLSCSIRKHRLKHGRRRPSTKAGYVLIYPEKRKRVYEHRYVMEKFLSRKLDRREHVHHKDGNITNNNINNLELISASDHAKLHCTPERAKQMSAKAHEKRRGYASNI